MCQPPFEVWDVSEWEVAVDEMAGQEEKQWLTQPATGVDWLFKPPTDKLGFRQGEDWAEKVSSEIASLISVPCAEVQLAVRDGRPGSISRNLRPQGWEMQSGSLLLADAMPEYQPGTMNIQGRPGHSLQRIAEVLAGAGPPPGVELPSGFRAFDVFAGYMVLDAWIANRDRHDENWSILLTPPGSEFARRLCGSYDQAGGLGFNVRPAECGQRLGRQDGVLSWVRKGTAHRFEHSPAEGPVTLVEHAMAALALAGPETRRFWLDRLANVTHDTVVDLLLRVPNLSDDCRSFAIEVLRINRERLLEC
jgi:hypothetical protein